MGKYAMAKAMQYAIQNILQENDEYDIIATKMMKYEVLVMVLS